MRNIPVSEIFGDAADAVGGPLALAHRLHADEAEVRAWMEGRRAPPFGAAVQALQLASQRQPALAR